MRYFCFIILLTITGQLNSQSWEPVGAGVTRSDTNTDAVVALYSFQGKLYIGGTFVYSGQKKMNSLACWDGVKIDTVGRGIGSRVSTFTEYNGELCIGGKFYIRLSGHRWASNIILWNDSFKSWNSLGGLLGKNSGCPIYPKAFCIYNNELYAGGSSSFQGANPNSSSLVKWNGKDWIKMENDKKVPGLIAPPYYINAIIPYNGKLYFGSMVIYPASLYESSIESWDGSKFQIVGGGSNKGDRFTEDGFSHLNEIRAFAVYNGSLYAAGCFDTMGGKRIYNIARWNDTSWLALGAGIKGVVCSLSVYTGKLYAGGEFDSAGGKPARNIAVWDGNSWSAVGKGLEAKRHHDFKGRVTSLAVYNNELYAGGTFDFSGKTVLNNLARLNLKTNLKSSVKKK